jgi:PPOX class probable F420-dependent enzyme
MRLDPAEALRRAAAADHGVLGTLHAGLGPDLVPATFAIDGDHVAVPVDTVKPKSSARLQRTRNLEGDPRATLLVEQWNAADWSRLWWVRLRLERSSLDAPATERLETALRRRYEQYRDAPFTAVLTFRISEVVGWAATPDPATR